MCLRNAQGIGTFINIFNPEIIVLGTIAMAAGDLFLDPVKKYLPRFCWDEPMRNCELKVTALGRSIGEYSGFCVALNYLYEHGEWRKMPWQE
jgi:glucokinase